jgi:hypothetical protein
LTPKKRSLFSSQIVIFIGKHIFEKQN